MSYREPGIRITQKKNTSYTGAVGSNLPVCLVGSGLTTLSKTYSIVKLNAAYSYITDDDGDYVSFSAIEKIGNTSGATDYNTGDHLTDYSKSTQVIGSDTVDVIAWTGGVDDNTPVTGDTFYATVTETPSDKHYELKSFASALEVIAEYGDDIVNDVINNISLAAQIAIENTSLVYTIKAKKAGSTITASEINVALEKAKVNSDLYRIIPVDGPKADVNLAVMQHVNLMSDPEEASERVTLVAAEHSSTTFEDVNTNVGGYAEAIADYRVGVVYPDKATRILSDGEVHQLGGAFIAVALATMKSALKPEEAYTGKNINNFISLIGVAMTRSQKNILVNKGVMLLTQEKSGYPITVRHGVTTDMSNIQMREFSITELGDYVPRIIRPALKSYIGKNITASLITQIKGSVESTLGTMIRAGNILDGSSVLSIEQDEDNPDTIYISIRVYVPYPCNYIDIVVLYE